MKAVYIIECRDESGALDFTGPQPPVRDFTENELAKLAWQHNPAATLDGMHILKWISDNVDPRWQTRVKTW